MTEDIDKIVPEVDVTDRIIQGVTAGLPLTLATEAAGMQRSQVYKWLKKGEAVKDDDPDDRYARFYIRLQEALAQRSVSEVANIRKIARDDNEWRASAWLLARWHPDVYGEKATLEHTGPQGGPIQVEQPTDPEALAELKAAFVEAGILQEPETEDAEIVEEA